MHPILIQWGAWKLSTYGVFVALGYLTGIVWLQSRRREMGLDETKFWRLIYCIFFGAIVGGKLLSWPISTELSIPKSFCSHRYLLTNLITISTKAPRVNRGCQVRLAGAN